MALPPRRKKNAIKKIPVKIDKGNRGENPDKILQQAVDQFLDFLDAHKAEDKTDDGVKA